MASCSALWGTPLCHRFVPTHPSTISMTRVLTSFRLLCKYYLTFALKHFTYTSYPRSSIIFLTRCTAYHLAYYLPCFCVPDRAKSLRGRGFPLILFSPVFLMLRTTCCMAILTEQGVKEWMCAETESWFSACGPVPILGRGLAAIILLGIFWFPVICTACDIHCVRGFL